MNTSLWLSAIIVFLIAALIPAWALFSDPQSARRRRLERAHRDGIINANDYKAQLQQLGQSPRQRRPQVAIIFLLAIPMLGLVIYDRIGTPEALLAQPIARSGQATDSGEAGMSVEEAVASLRARLTADPDNPENVDGWALLGNSYENLGRRDEALAAYQKAYELAPDNIDVQVEYAEAQLFASPDGKMPQQGKDLLVAVNKEFPQHAKALWLLGVIAYQDRDFAQALDLWQELRQYVTQPEARQSLDEQIAQLKQTMGVASDGAAMADTTTDTATTPPTVDDGTQVRVRVEVTDELWSQRSEQGALFVFARSPQGGPPLASVRLSTDRFPLEVDLSDANAMLAGRNLSSAKEVVIGARWSNSGQALPQPGDLEGFSDPISLPTSDTVAITINDVR